MRTFLILAFAGLLIELTAGASYTVGGSSGGWNTGTDLQTWVQSQTFSVGDTLLFQYGPPHNVLEVTNADYDLCQTGNPIQVHPGGNTAIALSSAGKRYFICGAAGHCAQGMKLEIDIIAISTPPPTSPVNPPPTVKPPSKSPPPTTSTPSPPTPSLPPKSLAPSPDYTPGFDSPSTSPASISPTAPTVTSKSSPGMAPSSTTSPSSSTPKQSPSLAEKLTTISFVITMFMALLAI